MEEKNIWKDKWKYIVIAVCLVGAVGVFAFTKISSSAAKLEQKNQTAAALQAERNASVAKNQPSVASKANVDTSLGVTEAEAATGSLASGEVIASKNGTKYYPISCKSGSIIKEVNKVTFASAAEAEAAGYTMAKNCAKK